MYSEYGWRPYVTVAERRRKAVREMEKLKKKGHPVSPVVIEGREEAPGAGAHRAHRHAHREPALGAVVDNGLP